jgi:hypothetical protein
MNADQAKLKIQIFLAEYEKLRDELMYFQNNQQQNILLALGSASVAIPILLGQSANIPTNIIAMLLYLLTIVYAIIGMNFAYSAYSVNLIGKYIHEYLEPAMNQATQSTSKYKVLHWESYVRRERGGFPDVFLSNIGPIGSMVLLQLPGAIALLASHYVVLIPPTPQNPTLQYVSFWLPAMSIISWIAYSLSIASVIFLAVYHPLKSKSIVFR